MSNKILTVKDYVDQHNKSIHSSVSGYTERNVAPIRNVILEDSELLSILKDVYLSGKYTDIPFINPKEDESSPTTNPSGTDCFNPQITLGSLSVEKHLINVISKLSDETVEDSNPNIEDALNKVLSSSAILKLEGYIADKFSKLTPEQEVGASGRQFSAIVSLLKTFDKYIWSIKGPFIATMSIDSYLDFINTVTTGGKMLLQEGRLKLIPISGMSDDDLIVFHPHGLALGYDIKRIEEDRQGSKNSTNLVTQMEVGLATDERYVKRLSLS